MRPIVAVCACCATLVAVGCGQVTSAPKFKGEEGTVAAVVDDLHSDGQGKKADDICNKLLTPALQDKIKAGSATCAAEMKKALDDADTFDLEVQDVTVNGTTATARVKGKDEGSGVIRTLALQKVGNTWRIDSFGS